MPTSKTTPNRLFFGDNLNILRDRITSETVDLVYLDPPFNSNQSYNVLFKERDGSRASAQVKAFTDTWRWDEASATAFRDTVEAGGRVSEVLQAFAALVGGTDMLAYLSMMAPRLVQLHRVLKPTGSLYLHCDPTASHYLKLLLDAVFGPQRFMNEVIWKRTTAHSGAKKFGPVHDVLLYYTKSESRTWNSPRLGYAREYLDKYYRFDDGDGRLYWRADLCAAGIRKGRSGVPWRGIDPAAKGMHWKYTVEKLDEFDQAGRIYWPPGGVMPQYKRYRDELKGLAVSDMWDDIGRINPVGSERLGYPTQKPVALLDRIVAASSNPGDVVLDPFCGCGTAIASAQNLGRRWVGIDVTQVAIGIIRHRLKEQFGLEAGTGYSVDGEPTCMHDAVGLALQDRFQFQVWAVNTLAGRPVEQKKGKDRGIDGKLYFHDEPDHPARPAKLVVISVKSGGVGPGDIRDLRGAMEREKAAIGVLVTLEDPTKDMRAEAAGAGNYTSPGWRTKHRRLQILTVADIVADHRRIDMPPTRQTNVTLPPVPPAKPISKRAKTPGLFDDRGG